MIVNDHRPLKGAFVLKEPGTGKTLLEVTPRKLRRLARPMHGWTVQREEVRASTPDFSSGVPMRYFYG